MLNHVTLFLIQRKNKEVIKIARKKQITYSGKIEGYNVKGESGKQEITISLNEEETVIPVGSVVEVKILKGD